MAAIQTKEMSIKEFTKIQDNPAQRDTIVHAKLASKRHLSTYHVSHGKVAIAVNGKERWKLDGHTRSYLWAEGRLTAPSILLVDFYKVANREEAANLYQCFDSHDAVESKRDQLIGAIKFHGIKSFNTTFVRNVGIINAISHIERAQATIIQRETIRDKVGRYKKPLKVLLAQGWQHTCPKKAKTRKPGFNSMAVSAFLVTYKLHGDTCMGFWDNYINASLTTMNSGKNAAYMAAQWMIYAKDHQLTMGKQNSEIGVVALLNAYNLYRKKQTVKRINELYKADRNKSTSMQIRELLVKMKYA